VLETLLKNSLLAVRSEADAPDFIADDLRNLNISSTVALLFADIQTQLFAASVKPLPISRSGRCL
jgi:hypothetical protein